MSPDPVATPAPAPEPPPEPAAAASAGPLKRMGWFKIRRLTQGEMRLARQVFGDAIAYRHVRIVQLPPLFWGAMVPVGRRIYYARWRAATDFALADRAEQGWFIHELAHVWQAQRGAPLAIAKLGALGRGAYKVPKAPFAKMGIEAQAEVARKLFLARTGAPDPDGPNPEELEKLWTEAPKRRKERLAY
ncbi:MAG: hypothetical protein GC206_16325 [Alphaproteobacteria bacterium]|nr:hypothetical protein [Alphaproteobacteria bacterium]